ncbi:MAG: DegT/DnrJ/EryC1/StrS family aminotransferase [Puniceicoccales bacterium]|jgi:dTDP-4-amino-4,6-dideoxygalactose transaminase|nr:DegT/DnrJ/EryC1/StrS family aminotransferase [Puniceicoccales bacterium]
MNVKLLDLVAQNGRLKTELIEKFSEIIDSGNFILGPEVERFEKNTADYLSCGYTLGASSGTDALLLALMAMEIGPGDDVLCPGYTFFGTAGCATRLGARPVFVDVNCDDFCISIPDLEAKITPRTRVIIGVHLFGQACNCEAIVELCEKHKIRFIEDCAQSFGARRNGRQSGTFGDVGCFSFFPSKNLGGFGDSGLVCTDDGALYERMKILRTHGMSPKYSHKYIGGNFRMDALQAILLNVKLGHLGEYIGNRVRNAEFYLEKLADLEDSGLIALPKVAPGNSHTWNQFTIKIHGNGRDGLKRHLLAHGIGCEVYYHLPLNRQECFAKHANALPVSEALATQVLSLPVYPELAADQLDFAVAHIKSFFEHFA